MANFRHPPKIEEIPMEEIKRMFETHRIINTRWPSNGSPEIKDIDATVEDITPLKIGVGDDI